MKRPDRLEFARRAAYLPSVATRPKANTTMATNPLQFLQQVRSETAKVHWPTRKEVVTTTIMVFVMAAITSLFFFLVDKIIQFGLLAVLGLGG
jgi:preprotein translocase subunit SecE